MTQKSRNFHLPSHNSLSKLIGGRGMLNSSGLECEVCVVIISGLKVKEGGFRVRFVMICE